MRYIYGVIMWLVATSLVAQIQCDTPDDAILDAIVRVGGGNTEATGVVIDKNLVLTAAHVVADMETAPYVGYYNSHQKAEIIAIFPDYDLALLVTDTGSLTPIPFKEHALYPLEPVWTIGYPRAGNLTTASGVFKSDLEEGEIHVTAYVDSGQSGGGLLSCEYGRFVLSGMIKGFGAIDHGDYYTRVEGYSVAVPAKDIRPFVYQNVELARFEQ